jgi:yeast amino acid transporter
VWFHSAIVVFALSCASNAFYTGSRVLYGLALDHQAPAVFRKVTVGGRPLLALGFLGAWCFSSYMGQVEDKSGMFYMYIGNPY